MIFQFQNSLSNPISITREVVDISWFTHIYSFSTTNYFAISDEMDVSDTTAIGFFVGWDYSSNGDINLILTRFIASQQNESMAVDISNSLILSTNHYALFSPSRKPSIFWNKETNLVTVIVPDMYTHYFIVNVSGSQMNLVKKFTDGHSYSALLFSKETNNVYVASSTWDSEDDSSGYIRCLNIQSGTWQSEITFSIPGANFPSTLAIDDSTPNPYLYVGFSGGPSIIKLTTPHLKIVGHVRLPLELSQLSSAQYVQNHVYFCTGDNKGKVFRIETEDFCPSLCGANSACKKGTCICFDGYDSIDGTCKLQTKTPTSANSSTILLSILVLIAVGIAVIGFVLYYRARKNRNYVEAPLNDE